MAANKTTETTASVDSYLHQIQDEKRRLDCSAIVRIMEEESGFAAAMWGTSIVGFGSYHYKYASGHEGDAPLAGLSSRSNAIVLYLHTPESKRAEMLAGLGKFKSGKSCIYIKNLKDVDEEVLREMVRTSVASLSEMSPTP